MPKVEIPIAPGFYQDQSLPVSAQECTNLTPVYPQTVTGREQQHLTNCFSYDEFAEFTGSSPAIQAVILHKDLLYVVIDELGTITLHSVNSSGTKVSIGTLSGGSSGSYQIAENGESIAIVEVGTTDGWFYDTTGGIAKITDATYIGSNVNSVTHVDGFFVYTRTDSNEFFISSNVSVNKGQNFDALDFATAELSSDNNIKPFALRGELYIAGQKSIEAYRNVGGSGFPFQRIEGGHFEKGIRGVHNLVVSGDRYYFVGEGPNEDLSVYMGGPSSLQKISTQAVDVVINNLSDDLITDADVNLIPKVWVIKIDGNTFVGVTFQSGVEARATFVYDLEASSIAGKPIWHRRHDDLLDKKIIFSVSAFRKIFAVTTGAFIGEVTYETFTNDGQTVERTFVTRYINNKHGRIINPKLELSVEAGTGAASPDDPLVTLSISDDGGRTFTSMGSRGIGSDTDYTKRLVWHQLGLFNDMRCYKFTVNHDAKITFTGLTAILNAVS